MELKKAREIYDMQHRLNVLRKIEISRDIWSKVLYSCFVFSETINGQENAITEKLIAKILLAVKDEIKEVERKIEEL